MRRSLPPRLPSLLRSTTPFVHRPSVRTTFPVASVARHTLHAHLGRAEFSTSRPHRDDNAPRSPFKVFVETLKAEIEKNRELQENVKQLQGDVGKMQDSESLKKAKDLYERARITSILKNNPKLQEAADEMKRTGVKVSDAVGEALRQVEESEFLRALAKAKNAVSSAAATATAPVRNTEAYKALAESVSEVFDDSSTLKYGGFMEKDIRRKRRQARLEKLGRAGMGVGSRVKVNEEAGNALVLSKDNVEPSKWDEVKANSSFFSYLGELKERYHESESPVISAIRTVTDKIGSLSEENEFAKVTRQMRTLDPSFDVEGFVRDLKEYIVPEVLDAYLGMDKEALKAWCGEASYSMLWATMEQYHKQGLVSESKVVTIQNVDVSTAKFLDNDVPAYLVAFSTQEIVLFRHTKTGEVLVGDPTRVESVAYAAVFARVEEELEDEITGGWKVLEIARRGATI
ncbi:Mitochondrial import inner membrane translocase, subunit TIM44 [Phaffia rhodozyma]|uniref:Mitochondrial import inner membrane translocase subunit TIM44 n=1 Tax=Phaffia rhodozyma TaxID=264483 RepID=A0A0F7SI19_PHARH|nr:Mitochondrial import inner membrane translocase, subunit TIM44 [Phaffia rhodozyma]